MTWGRRKSMTAGSTSLAPGGGIDPCGVDGVGGGLAGGRRNTLGGVQAWSAVEGLIEFPDGRTVRGRGLRRRVLDGPSPVYGVYLAARDPGPFDWEHDWIEWRDFRLPTDTEHAVAVLTCAYGRAEAERVEIACGGGIGRTGTALAVMAVVAGVAPADAVGWVRGRYHRRAVETPWQKRWIANLRLST